MYLTYQSYFSMHKNDMHGHISKQYGGIIRILKAFNLENNIKTLNDYIKIIQM